MHPRLPLLPYPIAGLSACIDDNRLYIIGGYSNGIDKAASKQVAYLESGSDHWVHVHPMNIARKFSLACALDQCIYVMGGDSGSKCTSLERYDRKTEKWELLVADFGISISRSDRLTAFDDHIYYLTHSDDANNAANADNNHYYNNYKKYDKSLNEISSDTCNRDQILRTVRFIDKSI